MKFKLFAIAAILILNAHQTHTEESFLKKLFTAEPMSDELRFPHLSQLPKRSIIRQKCLNSSYFLIKNGSHQDACERLENHIRKHVANKGAWRYERIKIEDRSELEKEALGRVYDDYNKQLTIIMNATQPEFEVYLRKQGIDPENDPKTAEKQMHWIYVREPQAVNLLFRMAKYKYEAKHTLDEASRQKNIEAAQAIEDAFTSIDSKAAPDDFRAA
jgi:hypothetical protein